MSPQEFENGLGNLPPVKPDIAREVDRFLEEKHQSVDPLSRQIRDALQYRLMGFDLCGKAVSWRKEAADVLALEQTLVIDPEQVSTAFRRIREYRKHLEDEGTHSSKDIDEAVRDFSFRDAPFSLEGGHVSLNTPDRLYRVRREGWVILAGILDARKRFHTVATNYGLSNMPEDDEEFLLLSKSTLVADDDDKDTMSPDRISFNWRTSVARSIDAELLRSAGIGVPEGQTEVSTRRIGIGSTLKYIIARIAQLHDKDAIYFNIATLLDRHPKSKEKIFNAPSFLHNKRYFLESKGHRSIKSDVMRIGRLGLRIVGAKAKWKVYGDEVGDVMHNLVTENSVLTTRQVDLDRLEEAAGRIANQMNETPSQ